MLFVLKLIAVTKANGRQFSDKAYMVDPELVYREARDLYLAWLERQGFKGRSEQTEMLKFIVGVLTQSENRIGVMEAGTGTGKTIAYCIAGALTARAAQKKLVLVTSTVVLQHQMVNGELKQLSELMPTPLSYGLVKGRQRYACIHRLKKESEVLPEGEKDLFGEVTEGQKHRSLAVELFNQFNERRWSGDMDELEVGLTAPQKQAFTTDFVGCNSSTCEFARPCPYFRARQGIHDLDVIVTNYSLLLAATSEGVDLLPDPNDCIFIFDEAHKLPQVVRDSTKTSTSTNTIASWVKSTEKLVTRLVGCCSDSHPLDSPHQSTQRATPIALRLVSDFARHLSTQVKNLALDRQDDESINRFPGGVVDEETMRRSEPLAAAVRSLTVELNGIKDALTEAISLNEGWINRQHAAQGQDRTSNLIRAGNEIVNLLTSWKRSREVAAARWFLDKGSDLALNDVNIAVDEQLREKIWEPAHGVICTSATLYASDGLEHFFSLVGIDLPERQTRRIQSPFDVKSNVKFQVADIEFDRPGGARFNAAAAALIPTYLRDSRSGLLIFNAWRDLDDTYQRLPEKFRKDCIRQGEHSLEASLNHHRRKIDNGGRSFLLGTESYREGIDLPGDYCQHVIIMRLPFMVPTDPVIKTHKERMELTNGFMEFDVPDASLRLFQACGRLLRSENDRGSITVFDRRIITAQYSGNLLRPLPRYDIVDLAATRS